MIDLRLTRFVSIGEQEVEQIWFGMLSDPRAPFIICNYEIDVLIL